MIFGGRNPNTDDYNDDIQILIGKSWINFEGEKSKDSLLLRKGHFTVPLPNGNIIIYGNDCELCDYPLN